MNSICNLSTIYQKSKIASRILLAIFGSYLTAFLISVLPLALPILNVSAVAWGKIIGVVGGSFTFVLIFCIYSLKKAWIFMIILNFFLFFLCWYFVPNFTNFIGK